MSFEDRLDLWGRNWRGPLLAALIALIAALPGLLALPPIDRDESRFAEASAQMLESGDFVSIQFQDTPRFKKPVGIYWLQAAATAAVSHVEDRQIWSYRLPSLLGAMLAAAACAWGAAAFLRPSHALLAGAILGASFMLSTEADIAATDAVLCGAITLAMAALARLYLASRGGSAAGRRTKALFWAGLSLSVLVKGPIGPMVVGLTLLSLWIWDCRASRQVLSPPRSQGAKEDKALRAKRLKVFLAPWLLGGEKNNDEARSTHSKWIAGLGWGWGLIFLLALVGPWALAITVATDGAFWGAAVGGDLAPKLMGGQEGHGAPPGYYALLAPVLLFPAALMLPAGLVAGWRLRAEPAVRFALCWLIPSWLVFELTPTKLIHYTLPLYGALAWLMARALSHAMGRITRWAAIGLTALGALAMAAASPAVMGKIGDWSGAPWAAITALLAAAAFGASLWFLWHGRLERAVAVGGAFGAAAHMVLLGAVAPSLTPLWLSARAAKTLTQAGLNPQQGVAPGPVTVAGYEEPSLVFLLGAPTELGDGDDAAAAIHEGRSVIVEARDEAAFQRALAGQHLSARLAGQVTGLDYSNNQHDILRIYRPLTLAKITPESN